MRDVGINPVPEGTPAPDDTGTAGQVQRDEDFIYLCTDTDTWKRSHLFNYAEYDLTYSSDGDSNGLFYLMGTNFGAISWTNPNTSGQIIVSASNLGSGTLSAIVNRDTSDTFDNPQADAWFKFDLGSGRSLILNKISFRQRSGAGSNASQDVQGSNDNTNWTTLVSPTVSLTANAWTSTTVTPTVPYRYFRLIQTGVTDYFTIGEVELYGRFVYEF